MFIYGIINLLIAVLFAVLGICIFRGNIGLIHDYHQKKVNDKINYGKSMGMAIGAIGIFALISGFVAFIPDITAFIPVGIFVVGFIICFFFIFKAQRKYNGGMF